MHKALILGGSGLVGRAIINEMNKLEDYQIYGTFFNNKAQSNNIKYFKLDIENLDNLFCILNTIKPEIIVSCLRGNYEKQLLLHKEIAKYLNNIDGKFYFCSTTNVFDNDISKPHYEYDTQNSCTDYGNYKIECESIIKDILNDNAIILRLPQVWGKDCPRIKQLIELLSKKEKIIVYPKLFYNTNTDLMIAKQVSYIVKNNIKGIFHLASNDVINHKAFYKELITAIGYDNIRFEDNYEEEGFFALLSKRDMEFPVQLRVTNKSVIDYLVH